MQRIAIRLSLVTLAALASAPAHAQWSTESLSQARGQIATVTVGDWVLFAGGGIVGSVYARVDAYNTATDTWTWGDMLSVPRSHIGATVVGDRALFAGGLGTALTDFFDVVDVYDASIGPPDDPAAWSTARRLSQERGGVAATTVGSQAFFAGGAIVGSVVDVVDVYDASIGPPSSSAAWRVEWLRHARAQSTAVTVGGLAVFAGGWLAPGGVPVDYVDVYDESKGLWSEATLSVARILGADAAAVVGTRAYFGGGHVSTGGGAEMSDVVDVFDAVGGTWSSETLSVPRGYVAAAAVGNTVLFAGGVETGHVPSDVVDTLNTGTGKWGSTFLPSQAGRGLCAASVGSKAMFVGARDADGIVSDVVDVYEPVGVNYCLANPNSTGGAATISALGSASIGANDLVLRAECVPDQPFVFFHGGAQVQIPFGHGLLCAAGGITRILPPGFATGQVAERAVDLPGIGITAPGVRNFQCWFRDPAAGGSGFNLSDGFEITFVP